MKAEDKELKIVCRGMKETDLSIGWNKKSCPLIQETAFFLNVLEVYPK